MNFERLTALCGRVFRVPLLFSLTIRVRQPPDHFGGGPVIDLGWATIESFTPSMMRFF